MEESTSPLSWQEKYKLARLKVKAWESEYVAANGSRPDKLVLSAAPDSIKSAYKTYVHYRKRIESLGSNTEYTKEEEVQDTQEKNKQKERVKEKNKDRESSLHFEEVNNDLESTSSSGNVTKSSNVAQTAQTKTANGIWGRHLNKDAGFARVNNKSYNSPGSLYSKMAEKMRANGTVKMRTSLKKLSNVDWSAKGLETDQDKSQMQSHEDKMPGNGSVEQNDKSLINKENINQSLYNSNSNTSILEEPVEKPTGVNDMDKFQENVKKHEENATILGKSNSILNTESAAVSKISVFDSLNNIEHSSSCISHTGEESVIINSSVVKLPFKMQKKHCTQKVQTQAVSALTLTPDRLGETHIPKKKGALNRGWLARCTGSELEDVDNGTFDDWKLKLTDREWNEDDNCDPTGKKVFLEEDMYETSSKEDATFASLGVGKIIEQEPETPAETQQSETDLATFDPDRHRSKDEVSKNKEVHKGINAKRNGAKGIAKTRKNKEQPVHPDTEEALEEWKASPKNRHPKKVNKGDIASPALSKQRASKTKVSEGEQLSKNKRKRKDTLEELELSGKIQSSWPPPKKVRSSKVKARNNLKELSAVEKESEEPGLNSKDKLEYNELDDIEKHGDKTTNVKSHLSKEERFRKKVITGAANNNFVRINLKKKTFVRGHKHINGSKYRRQEWKRKQSMKSSGDNGISGGKSFTCFKCGDFGHWAKFCPGKKGDKLMAFEDYNENESTFLSLEDAAALAHGIKTTNKESLSTKMYPKVEEFCSESVDLSCKKQEISDLCNDIQDTNSALVESSHVDDSHKNDFVEGDSQMDEDNDIFAYIDEDHLTEDFSQTSSFSSQHTNVKEFSNTPESSFSCTSYEQNLSENRPTIKPLYTLDNGEVGTTPEEVHETLKMFGYSSFRAGQENAIMRILSGQSTLLVLSTGSGKSLCYQLPAYLYAKHNRCITLCVSPLVSLMEDQVTGLPAFLHAVCLHTHQNSTQRSNAVNAIRSGRAHILLISPEAVVASRSGGVLGTLLRELPPVAFACLDEAHCVSEWSHNFRPSYLRICQVLRERLGVQTILGLTATARHSTAVSIAKHLLIPDFDTGIIRGRGVPDNLRLSVSRDENREQALITLLQADRFCDCSSIIIYCTRRDECERIATLIRTQLLNPSKVDVQSNLKRTKGISMDAEAYHAGLSSHRRQQVQKKFMSGKLRIVVATVAFGMGIDKSDVRGIIHFNMPRNIESYVQEIGRAGRDGKDAHCHLFLDAVDGKDIQELKRHIFANSMDRHTVRKLLNKIFKPCACAKVRNLQDCCDPVYKPEKDNGNSSLRSIENDLPVNQATLPANADTGTTMCASNPEAFAVTFSNSSCPKHEVAIPINSLVEELDLPSENIETLLCYLELHQSKLIHMNSPVYATCTVSCYAGPRQLVAVSRKCPPLAVAIAFERQKGVTLENKNQVVFPVVDIASQMGWNSKIVKRELKSLEWNTHDLSNGGKVKRSGVTIEFSDLSYHMDVRGDLSDDECDQLLDALYLRTQTQERDQLRQVQYIYQLLRSVSHGSVLMCCDSVDTDRENKLRVALREYFKEGSKVLSELRFEEQVYIRPEIETSVRSSVRAVLSTHLDNQWTGRAIARVFHGIGSPNFPAEVWGRVRRFWRLHLNVDFNIVLKLATQEIIRFK